MPFAQQQMGFDRPPKLFLRQNLQNAIDPMGKTGFYDPQNESITIYISGRHPKDIMRSLAHELMHHTQKCNGDFDQVQNMGEQGYAQADPHMRTMEIEAYQASIVFRDWEDSLKETIYYEHLQKGDKSSMSAKNWKNKELNGLLMERFGFEFKPLVENLNEGAGMPKSALGAGPSNKAGKIERSDVANQDTSDFGEAGSGGGGKPSASGTNAAPKAGKLDRSDVANKATGRWLKEEEDIFAPNHYCVHHGGVEHNGSIEMAEAVNHNYNKRLGRVTHYDMKLSDGTILENVAAEDIQVTNASLAEAHPGKRDAHKPVKKGSKPDYIDIDKDGDKEESMKKAAKDAKEGDLDEQAAKRYGNEDRDVGRDRMHADRMHEMVSKLHKAGFTKNQIKESLTNAFNKARKG